MFFARKAPNYLTKLMTSWAGRNAPPRPQGGSSTKAQSFCQWLLYCCITLVGAWNSRNCKSYIYIGKWLKTKINVKVKTLQSRRFLTENHPWIRYPTLPEPQPDIRGERRWWMLGTWENLNIQKITIYIYEYNIDKGIILVFTMLFAFGKKNSLGNGSAI
jgi:hypothetical protein